MTTSTHNTRRPSRRPSSSAKPRGRNQRKGGSSQAQNTRNNSRRQFGSTPNRAPHNARRRPVRSVRKKKAVLDISAFINKAVVTTEEVEHFVPEHAFSDFAVNETIKQTLKVRGYTHPTPIQDKIIPHVLRGEDVVGLANTGTGKTAAFLIPLIEKILNDRKEQVLVLTPTRELAIQIEDEFMVFAKRLRLSSVVIVGGVPVGKQLSKLRGHNHFVIGTPGRVIDLIKRGKLNLSKTRTVVLDEADRMLDMGFINDIRYILGFVPKEKHTLCFSATMAPPIEKLIKDFLVEPTIISVKTQATAKNVEQDVVKMAGRDKATVLFKYLSQDEYKKTLVFGRTKHGVEKLARNIKKRGLMVESIHGDKSHSQRQRALKNFKDGTVSALMATDVAARGLDISGITHVINYDVPETYDDYIHRIGRTGRGKNKGKALTFVD